MKVSKFEKIMTKEFLKRLASTNLEIEQKYSVPDIHPIRLALKRLGAVKVMTGQEHNELFDADRKLRNGKQILRLRYHGATKAWLTFKGPRLKGKHKRRIEIETPVMFEETKRILLLLGFRVIAVYRKYREEFKLKPVKVFLDFLPKVGWFVEIEGYPKAIRAAAKKIGLDETLHEQRSYRKILQQFNRLV